MTAQTEACQAPLSMGFSRQEYLSGLPAAKPGNLKTEVWRMCCFLLFGCAWSLLLEVAYLLVVVQGLLTAEASLAAKRKLSSCDSWAWLPHSMWGLHGRGIKFVPPRWQWTLNQSTAREAQVCKAYIWNINSFYLVCDLYDSAYIVQSNKWACMDLLKCIFQRKYKTPGIQVKSG